MESIIFTKLDDNLLTYGKHWIRLRDSLNELKTDYKVDPQTYDNIRGVMRWIDDYTNLSSQEYINHLNKVKSLIGKYWKVSRLTSDDRLPLCYMYPYSMNPMNNYLFVMVSMIDIDDFLFSGRRALGEIGFDYTQLGNQLSCDNGLLFEEVDEEEMIHNAQAKCEELFSYRHNKMKEMEASKSNNNVCGPAYGPGVSGKCSN